MKSVELLMKLGEISDDMIEEAAIHQNDAEKQISLLRPKRLIRRGVIGVAAVLVLMLGTLATAMAVNEEFREAVVTFFHITSPDVVLPVEGEPSGDDLNEHGDVERFYRAGIGDAATVEYIRINGDFELGEGMIYRYNDLEKNSVSFYAVSKRSEVIPLDADFVETQVVWKDQTYDICFDWCVYDGHVGVYARYQASVNDAYWTVEPIPGRTDLVLLTLDGGRAFFFDLQDSTVIDPFADCDVDELGIIHTEFSPDLKKAWLACDHGETVWYCDTERNILTTEEELLGKEAHGWFIDSDTIGYYTMDSSDRYTYSVRSLSTGEERVILEDVPLFGSNDSTWGIMPTGDRYGIFLSEDGSVYALDFKTGERRLIEGYTYPTDKATRTIPNRDGSKIAFVTMNHASTGLGISQIGVLNLTTQTFTLLDREGFDARHEATVSWFDEDRIVIWAVNENDHDLYLYTIPAELP
jgi:hypothetical protein